MKRGLLRWWLKKKAILADILSSIGSLWWLVEFSDYITNGKVEGYIRDHVSFFAAIIVLIIIFVFCINRPKKKFAYRINGKDNIIEVKVGDAFKNKGALIIPFNDYFDVSLGGNVRASGSLQNQLIKKYYNDKEEHLEHDIKQETNCSKPHEIGTTIEIIQKNKKFYLLVNSKKKSNNRVESTENDFLNSLAGIWNYISSDSGRDVAVTIPLLNVNHGRMSNLNRSDVIKDIIRSFVNGSKRENITEKLIISIHHDDVLKENIDLDEIDEFLEFSCKHVRKTNPFEQPTGTAI